MSPQTMLRISLDRACVRVVVAILAVLAAHAPAQAQLDDVKMSVPPSLVGIGGVVRAGSWTPLCVELDNRSSQPRRVVCEWVYPDADGDQVGARRVATIGPGLGRLWLYGHPAHALNAGLGSERVVPASVDWRVRLIELGPDDAWEGSAGRLVASVAVPTVYMLDARARAVGVVGTSSHLGLRLYEENWTQHEPMRLMRDLTAASLPDRWHGLSMLEALIWTPAAGDPDAPSVGAERRAAIREWVRRGGHLVIVLSSAGAGQTWTRSSMADLLPAVTIQPITEIPMPSWLGGLNVYPRLDVNALIPRAGRTEVSVLLTEDPQPLGRPLVVARQYGLGRVTVVGVDITDPRLAHEGLPNATIAEFQNPRRNRLWAAVFGWRGPVFSETYLNDQMSSATPKMLRPDHRHEVSLDGEFLPSLVNMSGTAASVLLASILGFGLYWLLAGPVSFAALRSKGMTRHAWLAFVAVVVAFSLAAWSLAGLLRSRRVRAEHFTVLTVDAATGQSHVHSWMSVYTPKFGRSAMALGTGKSPDTLSSPGLTQMKLLADGPAFVDPQRYVMDAAAPRSALVPTRGTAKYWESDVLAASMSSLGAGEQPWLPPEVREPLVGQGQTVKGLLVNRLPASMINVVVLYCPGDGAEPLTWRWPRWDMGQELRLDNLGPPVPLMEEARDNSRAWPAPIRRGLLADLTRQTKGGLGTAFQQPTAGVNEPAVDVMTRLVDTLTFYGSLPSPEYWSVDSAFNPATYSRRMGREIDLTPLLAMRRIIIIGHLPRSASPLPLTLDGQGVASSGWTAVRFVYSIE